VSFSVVVGFRHYLRVLTTIRRARRRSEPSSGITRSSSRGEKRMGEGKAKVYYRQG